MLHPIFRSVVPSSLAAALLTVALAAGNVQAQGEGSAAAAAELGRLLDAAKLDSIAAVDPDDPSLWIAALYFKDSQFLVVSAKYAAPVHLIAKMKVKDYRDIYLALYSSPMAGTRVFVMDSSANGLSARAANGDAPDSWDHDDVTITFDGNWRRQKMSEDEYRKAYADADARYTRMLRLLAAEAKGPSGT